MVMYRDDLAIDKVLRSSPGLERTILRIYTGREISEPDAKVLWQRILDHKWYVSEQLSRDVGFRVAAIDYVEHFYEPFQLTRSGSLSGYAEVLMKRAGILLRKYLEAKGNTIPI